MSNLENLVPPLELCKLIPAGEFKDSYFVRAKFDKWVILLRNCVKKNKAYITEPIIYPAPTLQEIMEALPASNIYRIKQTWTANFINDSVDNGIKSTNPATAALQLFLKQSDRSETSEPSDQSDK